MNGNNVSKNIEFDQYLKRFDYKFKNESKEFGGYAIIYNKKISLIMDVGSVLLLNFLQHINQVHYHLKSTLTEKN